MQVAGKCSLCLQYGKLTFEHIPPRRLFNDRPAVAHTLNGLEIGSKHKKQPALLPGPAGLGRHTLCQGCNGRSAAKYGEAFADWTVQCLRYAQRIADSNQIFLSLKIQPLNVLKQIATMIMAVSESTDSAPSLDALRAFALSPNSMDFPKTIVLAAYLNPIDRRRSDARQLTQNRLSRSCAVLDTRNGSSVFVIGEVAFPPMGYVAYMPPAGRLISQDFTSLRDLRGFSNYYYNQTAAVFIDLPVRRPFGPVPGYYPQPFATKTIPFLDDDHVILTTDRGRPRK